MNAVCVASKTTHKPRGLKEEVSSAGTSSENVRYPCYGGSKLIAKAETTLKYQKLVM
jgi:hypothetical protein